MRNPESVSVPWDPATTTSDLTTFIERVEEVVDVAKAFVEVARAAEVLLKRDVDPSTKEGVTELIARKRKAAALAHLHSVLAGKVTG